MFTRIRRVIGDFRPDREIECRFSSLMGVNGQRSTCKLIMREFDQWLLPFNSIVPFENLNSSLQISAPGDPLPRMNSPSLRGTVSVLASGVQMHSCALNGGMIPSLLAV